MKKKSRPAKARNPFVIESLKKKAGLMKNRKEKRKKQKLRKQIEEQLC